MTDKILKSISKNGHFRAFALDSTLTVREAQERHQTMPTSTVALGRTLIAAQILGANEKGDSKITVKILGDGAMGAIVAVADAKGNVKGYVQNKDLDYKKASTGEVLVAPFIGNGFFVVIKDMGLRQPYTGQTDLITGEIGEDLAWYFLSSEQTPSSVGLNVLLNDGEDSVKIAGGFMLQALPDATDDEITLMEKNIKAMPSISEMLLKENPLEAMLAALYGELEYTILAESPLAFKCDCSKDQFAEGLQSLGSQALTEIIEEDHGAEVLCQFCGRKYEFTEKELNDLILGAAQKLDY
ncbi:Hsp33 family molecular chaperone HslO [Lactococcus petauri]|uniref:Hsp33 family molecular chaperone HslO n=2 Tax=Lactococcus petauri TaxID=1940789 RepID=UPI0018AAEEEF|nr:Hsp33 family molecular chaperone HslO [Lactococcus petauri]MDC0826401.1 Hsp33 family molecular chaperone HslO [Lactococcus petauri]